MYCTRCDYRLTSLAAGPCPECGTPFDPTDPSTCLTRTSRARRRWRRIVGGVVAALGLWVLRPTMVVSTTATLSSASTALTIRRVQLGSPAWLPVPYPWWTTSSGVAPSISDARTFTITARDSMLLFGVFPDSARAGSMNANATMDPNHLIPINDLELDDKGVDALVASLTSNMAMGRQYGFSFAPEQTAGAPVPAVASPQAPAPGP